MLSIGYELARVEKYSAKPEDFYPILIESNFPDDWKEEKSDIKKVGLYFDREKFLENQRKAMSEDSVTIVGTSGSSKDKAKKMFSQKLIAQELQETKEQQELRKVIDMLK